MPDLSHPEPPEQSAPAGSPADAVSNLRKATDSLRGTRREPSREATPPPPPAVIAEEERRRYYRDLEERGALTDVGEGTDLDSLPSRVTHVRYPDGRVERVGYT